MGRAQGDRVRRGHSSCSKCLEMGGMDGDLGADTGLPHVLGEQAAP